MNFKYSKNKVFSVKIPYFYYYSPRYMRAFNRVFNKADIFLSTYVQYYSIESNIFYETAIPKRYGPKEVR